MREGMKEANLSVPLFESDREGNKFILTLLCHHFFDERDLQWLKLFSDFTLTPEEARALLIVREMGAITNADYRNINCVDTLSASASLRRLRDCGLLESKGKSSQTYYVPGKTIALKETEVLNAATLSTELASKVSSLSSELSPSINHLSTELSPLSTELSPLSTELTLPVDLRKKLESLGQRISPNIAIDLILQLCVIKSFKLPELAFLLKRTEQYVRLHYLMPLIKSGKLEYVFPHQPNHPQQAYKIKQP